MKVSALLTSGGTGLSRRAGPAGVVGAARRRLHRDLRLAVDDETELARQAAFDPRLLLALGGLAQADRHAPERGLGRHPLLVELRQQRLGGGAVRAAALESSMVLSTALRHRLRLWLRTSASPLRWAASLGR